MFCKLSRNGGFAIIDSAFFAVDCQSVIFMYGFKLPSLNMSFIIGHPGFRLLNRIKVKIDNQSSRDSSINIIRMWKPTFFSLTIKSYRLGDV